MPNPQNNYVCPRCLYTVTQRYKMRRHFENLKNPCPNITGIILTDQIKDEVLVNHRYTVSQPDPHLYRSERGCHTINKTINNFNTVNNIISGMESMDKIKMISDHQGIRQIDFEDRLEQEFQYRLERMEQDKFTGGYCLNHDGLLQLVDGAFLT